MEEKIKKINEDILKEKNRLKDKAELCFSAISLPSTSHAITTNNKNQKPPITNILYGVAGLLAVGGLFSDGTASRLLCFGAAAASAYGGWKIGQNTSATSSSPNPTIDFNSLKGDVTSKVIEIVKKLKSDWDTFMDGQQKSIQLSIQNSTLDEDVKDAMISKICVYVVLDISLSDFNNQMRNVSTVTMMRSVIDTFKEKVTAAIESASSKQIEKYNSLLE